MKAWKKGAIVGAVWGIISGLSWLAMMMGGPLPSIWAKTVLFPGYFSFTFFMTLDGLLKGKLHLIPGSVQLFTFISLPILIGALIGSLMAYVGGKLR